MNESWRTLKEEQPRQLQMVLIHTTLRWARMVTAYRDDLGWWRDDNRTPVAPGCITHWMPLPKRPFGRAVLKGTKV